MSIKIDYTQTTWVNEVTPLNAQNMNNIDRALTSIKQALDNREFTAQSVGADPSGTAVEKVAEHNESQTPHSGVLAPIVHTHNLSEITNFPANNPTAADNGKVAIVKNGAWSANKLTFSDIDGELPYADISGAPTIPTKVSDLTNDLGYVTRGEVDQPAVIEYKGGKVATINLEFGYAPDHLIIQDFVGEGREPVATTVIDHDFSGQAQFVWGDFDVAIVTPVGGQFNEANHTYKVWGYALTSPNQVPDGDIIIAEDGQWTHADPEDLGFTSVIANPSTAATDDLTSVTIGDTTYNVIGTVDSALSSSSTNPVQNKVINSALSGKEVSSNKVTSITSSSTNTQYPSAKSVWTLVTNRVTANSESTPTDVLENIKIGNNIYSLPKNAEVVTITTSNFGSVSGNDSFREYQFKASNDDIAKITSRANENFILYFELGSSRMNGEAFAVSGKTVNGARTFNGVVRFTPAASLNTASFSMSFDSTATYPFKMYVALADRALNSLSDNPVSNSIVTTMALSKESTINKVDNFSTINSTTYPTTNAVYNYIVGNPSGQTSDTNLNYLRIGNDIFKIASGSSITVDDALSSSSTNPVQNKVIQGKISSIETSLTTFNISLSSLSNSVSAQSTAINGKQDTSNLVTSWSSTTSNSKYPSEKLVKDSINATNTVVSGLSTTVGAMQSDIDDLQDDIDALSQSASVQTSGTMSVYGISGGQTTTFGSGYWVKTGRILTLHFGSMTNGSIMFTEANISLTGMNNVQNLIFVNSANAVVSHTQTAAASSFYTVSLTKSMPTNVITLKMTSQSGTLFLDGISALSYLTISIVCSS